VSAACGLRNAAWVFWLCLATDCALLHHGGSIFAEAVTSPGTPGEQLNPALIEEGEEEDTAAFPQASAEGDEGSESAESDAASTSALDVQAQPVQQTQEPQGLDSSRQGDAVPQWATAALQRAPADVEPKVATSDTDVVSALPPESQVLPKVVASDEAAVDAIQLTGEVSVANVGGTAATDARYSANPDEQVQGNLDGQAADQDVDEQEEEDSAPASDHALLQQPKAAPEGEAVEQRAAPPASASSGSGTQAENPVVREGRQAHEKVAVLQQGESFVEEPADSVDPAWHVQLLKWATARQQERDERKAAQKREDDKKRHTRGFLLQAFREHLQEHGVLHHKQASRMIVEPGKDNTNSLIFPIVSSIISSLIIVALLIRFSIFII